jgi:hypothetical protein
MPRKMARQTLEHHAGACYAGSRPYLGSGTSRQFRKSLQLPAFRVHPGNPWVGRHSAAPMASGNPAVTPSRLNPNNVLRRLAKGPRWLLRRAGLDIVRYRGEGGSRQHLWNVQHSLSDELARSRQHLWNVQHSLSDELARLTDDTITAGPFKGARLPVSWRDRGSKLLGFYEQELHPFIEAVIEWKPDVVLNVGCAEGYYAIGMAKRIPGAKSFAYDLDPLAQAACKTTRNVNHVDLVVLGLCTDAELRERTEKAERPFMLVDCEGGERELLVSNQYSYPNARIIVECHDFVDRSITSSLVDKFSQTHSIQTIKQAGRNPFSHPITASWAENDLWVVVSERRPERMHWLYMMPKASNSALLRFPGKSQA